MILLASVPVSDDDDPSAWWTVENPKVRVVDVGRLSPKMDRGGPGRMLDVVRWLARAVLLEPAGAPLGRWSHPGGRAWPFLSASYLTNVLGVPRRRSDASRTRTLARVIDAGLLVGRLHRLSASRSSLRLSWQPEAR